MRRYLTDTIEALSRDRFLLLAGPRQVGKTTLAKAWVERGSYFNWDIDEDRESILTNIFNKKVEIMARGKVVLDEVHKYARWKAALKGLYDRQLQDLRFVVTGSARLDTYQKGGDSLLGRYEYLRVHPLTLGELREAKVKEPPKTPSNWMALGAISWIEAENILQKLEVRSGFPDPYFSKDHRRYNRWSNLRKNQLLKEDVRDLSNIQMISLLEHLILLLPERVGSPLSINSLREDLRVNHETVSRWIELLERLYYVFRISPFSNRVSRALRNEQKLYFWDWAQNEDEGKRFENLVASHLLKSVHLWTDLGYGAYDLRYIRNKEKKEIDFLITLGTRPVAAIECKLSDESPSDSWRAFDSVIGSVPRFQVVRTPGVDRRLANGIRVVSASRFFQDLN